MRLKIITLLIVTSFLINCSPIPTIPHLKLPPPITYPVVMASEVSCLTNEAFNKIKKRDKLKSARIETLRNIILSTH